MAAIQHMALGVYGFGCEDALTHLLNYVWPNVFENSPHVVQAFMGAIEGMRVGLGPSKVLQYALQVSSVIKQTHNKMSPVVRKPVFGVSDQVRHKPGCTATQDG